MLFPIQTVTDQDSMITNTESEDKDGKHVALMKANLLMDIHVMSSFSCKWES